MTEERIAAAKTVEAAILKITGKSSHSKGVAK